MIFDSHGHYDDERFDADRADLLSNMRQNNIEGIVNVGFNVETSETSVEYSEEYDGVYAAVGIHPSEVAYPYSSQESEIGGICNLLEKFQVQDYDSIPLSQQADFMKERNLLAAEYSRSVRTDVLRQIQDLVQENSLSRSSDKLAGLAKVVAIGEIGLDFYWDKDPVIQDLQREYFLAQMDMAAQLDMPVIIHSREAAEETFRIMKDYKDKVNGVIHCYSSSAEMAKEYVKMGYYIGVGGVVTFKNGRKLRQTVEAVSLDNILLETDCPYMAPEPHRGERNDSRMIEYVADRVAEIKGLSKQEVIDITTANSYRFYRINRDK